MSEKILFIGQAPSRETDGKPPFTGRCGQFLARLMKTTQAEMLEAHEFMNVLDSWPGAALVGKGDNFPMKQAKIAARRKLPLLKDRKVVLLGSNVARAFGCKQFQYGDQYAIADPDNGDLITRTLWVIPHPSGINRYYNNFDHIKYIEVFLRNLQEIARNSNQNL